jgi:hypothetical protein
MFISKVMLSVVTLAMSLVFVPPTNDNEAPTTPISFQVATVSGAAGSLAL